LTVFPEVTDDQKEAFDLLKGDGRHVLNDNYWSP